jgi:formylmethanofuran--tetrahydromethanopterin N-formyltransferase
MQYRGIVIEDTFCECTDIYTARLILTAATEQIAVAEASYLCGFGIITASPIQGCIEGLVSPSLTPDGRAGVALQLNAPTSVGFETYKRALLDRLFIFPHLPTCSLFDGVASGPIEWIVDLAARVSRWGDGYEANERIGGRDAVRLPIMTGDQHIERRVHVVAGTDGVLEVFGTNDVSCLQGAIEATAWVVRDAPGVAVFNYPIGGISGAKVGARRYQGEGVTINEPFCPSLRARVATKIPQGADCVIEFPLVATSLEAMKVGLGVAIRAFARTAGIVAITAPSFGGAWGGRKLALRDVVPPEDHRAGRD